MTTTTDRPAPIVRPSKPHLEDAIALHRGVQVTDLHLSQVRGYPIFKVTGEGRDRSGRRILIGGTVGSGRRPSIHDVTTWDPTTDDPFRGL